MRSTWEPRAAGAARWEVLVKQATGQLVSAYLQGALGKNSSQRKTQNNATAMQTSLCHYVYRFTSMSFYVYMFKSEWIWVKSL